MTILGAYMMVKMARRWGMIGLALAGIAAQVSAQERASGIVSGTVLNAATGAPVAGAQVVLRVSYAIYGFRERLTDRPAPADAARAVTDESGKFTIEFDPSLPASRLFVSREGFRSQGNREVVVIPLMPAGQSGITVPLVPQSLIRGRVFDAGGQPLRNIVIEAIRVEVQEGRRELHPNYANSFTNSRGEYQLPTLAPGSYYLEAFGAGPDERHGYGPQYFPDALQMSGARSVRLAAGDTVTADFDLDEHPVFRVRGMLANAPPERRVALRLMRDGEPQVNRAILTAGNKSFEFGDVLPGDYRVQAFTPDTIPADFGEAAVTVSDRDPAPLQINLSSALDVHGRIEIAGPKDLRRFAYIVATPMSAVPPLATGTTSKAMMLADGTFLLRNMLPGKYQVSARLLPDFYVASISAYSSGAAVDVEKNGLTVGTGRPPELKIAIRRGGGEIQGIVEGEKRDSVVVVQERQTGSIAAALNAAQGHFYASSLAPGEYDLYALPAAAEIEYRNPASLQPLAEYASHLVLRSGARENVTVRPVPANPVSPAPPVRAGSSDR
jgi:Carboxypeptidase regulatory-like domain